MNKALMFFCGVFLVVLVVGGVSADCLENWTVNAGNANCTNGVINMTGDDTWTGNILTSNANYTAPVRMNFSIMTRGATTTNMLIGILSPNPNQVNGVYGLYLNKDDAGHTYAVKRGGSISDDCGALSAGLHSVSIFVNSSNLLLIVDSIECNNSLTIDHTEGYAGVMIESGNIEISNVEINEETTTTTTTTTSTTETTTTTTSTTTTTTVPCHFYVSSIVKVCTGVGGCCYGETFNNHLQMEITFDNMTTCLDNTSNPVAQINAISDNNCSILFENGTMAGMYDYPSNILSESVMYTIQMPVPINQCLGAIMSVENISLWADINETVKISQTPDPTYSRLFQYCTTSTSTTSTTSTSTTTSTTTTTSSSTTTTTLGGFKITDVAGAVVNGMYHFTAGLAEFAGDISAVITLALFVFVLIGSAVLMTRSGRKLIKQ